MSSLVMTSVGRLNPSLYASLSSPVIDQLPIHPKEYVGGKKPTEHDVYPLSPRVTLGALAKDGQVQGRLELAELLLGRGEVEGGVGGGGGGEAGAARAGRCGDGDDVAREEGGDRVVDGVVESMVVAKHGVAAAEAAVVLDH